ncbi:unnamed protein product [Protopolystoma xenopodis]|uniref:Uncharacterized protein n=1 Tax=Protopolystoma xenopodis TaxID=117903 RepID=A0A3S5AYN6_9PLAT|nr:unnamed protein product [Protopolystoma xenopodis]
MPTIPTFPPPSTTISAATVSLPVQAPFAPPWPGYRYSPLTAVSATSSTSAAYTALSASTEIPNIRPLPIHPLNTFPHHHSPMLHFSQPPPYPLRPIINLAPHHLRNAPDTAQSLSTSATDEKFVTTTNTAFPLEGYSSLPHQRPSTISGSTDLNQQSGLLSLGHQGNLAWIFGKHALLTYRFTCWLVLYNRFAMTLFIFTTYFYYIVLLAY